MELVLEACREDKNLEIFVKDHPIMPLKKIVPINTIPINLKISNDNLNVSLKKSSITIISGPTSAILESYYMNNFLILPNIDEYKNKRRKTKN